MTENSDIFKEDLRWICEADLPWEKLRNSTILVRMDLKHTKNGTIVL